MVVFDRLSKKDILKYKDIISMGEGLFGYEDDELYKVVINGKEYILFVCGPIFTLLSYDENNKKKISLFTVDEDYRVRSLTEGEYQVDIYDDAIYLRHEDGNCYCLCFMKNNEQPDFEVSNNGVVKYMQHNARNNTTLNVSYEHYVCGDANTIYTYQLREPFEISIESVPKKGRRFLKFLGWKKSFYRLDFDYERNSLTYDIATLKDYGVGTLSARDTISLQGQLEFSRYYRTLLKLSDYITITGFPFTRQYRLEDLYSLLESLDLSAEIPEFLINIFNSKDELLRTRQEVADAFKASIYARENEKYLKIAR